MVVFERRRAWLGGALLASAILIKIFPAILLVSLAAHRRVRELGTTLVWGLAATAGAAIVFGPSMLGVFLTQHLPRLQSGKASNFGEVWPEIHDLVVAANQGVAGLLAKLTAVGLGDGLTEAGPVSSRVFLGLLTSPSFTDPGVCGVLHPIADLASVGTIFRLAWWVGWASSA